MYLPIKDQKREKANSDDRPTLDEQTVTFKDLRKIVATSNSQQQQIIAFSNRTLTILQLNLLKYLLALILHYPQFDCKPLKYEFCQIPFGMALGEKLFEESGNLTGVKITRVH
jgi:hypothetical protein